MKVAFDRRSLLICIGLVALSFAVFGQVRTFNFVQFDDPTYVFANPHVLQGITPASLKWALTGIHGANWHPLTSLSHLLDVQLFGKNAGLHHLVNVFLHAANVVLLFLFLWRTTNRTWLSALVAVLFAIHPLRVESVAWISERKDVLCGLFWMLTLLAYWRYVKNLTRPTYAAVATAFTCALLSKPMAITLPFVLMLLDFWPLHRLDLHSWKATPSFVSESGVNLKLVSWRRVFGEKVPLLLLCVGSALATIWAQQGAVVAMSWMPMKVRFLNSILSYVAYLHKTVWPTKLAMFYPLQRHFYLDQAGAALLLLVGITVAVLALRRTLPFTVIGWFWYVTTLLPVIGLVQVGQQAYADRYTYLPTIGIYIIIVWSGGLLVQRFPKTRLPLIASSILILCALSVAASRYTSLWRSDEPLFRHALAVTSNNSSAHCALGTSFVEQGRFEEAVSEFKQAIAILPGFTDAYVGLGMAYLKLNKNTEAVRCLRVAVKIAPKSSDNHLKLAIALGRVREWEESLEEFKTAVRLDPTSPNAHNNLAVTYYKRGQIDNAIVESLEALRLYPNNVQSLQALGWLWATDPDRLKPVEALDLSNKACRLTNFRSPYALQVLAAAQAANRKFEEAEATAVTAIRILEQTPVNADEQLRNELTIALELYRSGLPYSRKAN